MSKSQFLKRLFLSSDNVELTELENRKLEYLPVDVHRRAFVAKKYSFLWFLIFGLINFILELVQSLIIFLNYELPNSSLIYTFLIINISLEAMSLVFSFVLYTNWSNYYLSRIIIFCLYFAQVITSTILGVIPFLDIIPNLSFYMIKMLFFQSIKTAFVLPLSILRTADNFIITYQLPNLKPVVWTFSLLFGLILTSALTLIVQLHSFLSTKMLCISLIIALSLLLEIGLRVFREQINKTLFKLLIISLTLIQLGTIIYCLYVFELTIDIVAVMYQFSKNRLFLTELWLYHFKDRIISHNIELVEIVNQED